MKLHCCKVIKNPMIQVKFAHFVEYELYFNKVNFLKIKCKSPSSSNQFNLEPGAGRKEVVPIGTLTSYIC